MEAEGNLELIIEAKIIRANGEVEELGEVSKQTFSVADFIKKLTKK